MSIAIAPVGKATAASPGGDLALLLGRVALVAIFLVSGLGKVEELGLLEMLLRVAGVPLPAMVAVGVVMLELGAAVAILLGWRMRAGAAVLLGFTAVTTLLMHPFWAAGPLFREEQFVHFMKNIGLAGGLLLLLGTGPGRFAIGGGR